MQVKNQAVIENLHAVYFIYSFYCSVIIINIIHHDNKLDRKG